MSLIAPYYVGSLRISYNLYRLKKTKIELKKQNNETVKGT